MSGRWAKETGRIRKALASSNKEEAERLNDEGETLREQTPVFSPEVYDNLPPLLREALEGFDDVRERDIALLIAIGTLSVCLPGMWGQGKRIRNIAPSSSVQIE